MNPIRKLKHDEHPPELRETPEPPKQLFIEGMLPNPKEYAYICVVGSRKFSNYGRQAAEKIISELEGYPVVIVSGLAIGIDTIAHKAALEAKLKTVAIPGSGLDRRVLHPSSNRKLADKIVANDGALLSELEPMQPAGVHTFPKRNRIMAGISQGVLVIEAGERSGTLITSRLAIEYNRDVYAVPGSIFSYNSIGVHRLIAQGATPVTCGKDLLRALGFETTKDTPKQNIEDCSQEERKVLEFLFEPLPRDELVRKLKISVSDANIILTAMEIKGLIKETMSEVHKNF